MKFRGIRLEKRLYELDFEKIGVNSEAIEENFNLFGEYYLGSDGCIYEFAGHPCERTYVCHLTKKEFKEYLNETAN